jgi:anti-sigma regulatory factor (Ser/Thr protein kinase)
VVLASAGHPPPLLRRPGSAAEPMEIPHGVPLGVGASAYDEIQVELAAGTLLLAFTDGLVESRSLPFDEGIARLAASVGGAGTAEGVCDAALSGVGSLAGVGGAEVAARDDVALLALIAGRQAPPAANGGPQPVEADLAADPESPAVARALVGDALADWQLLGLLDTATLLTSELVTNAVRHAGTPLRLSVSRAARDRVRVAVTDRAPDRRLHLRRPSIADDGGRGLFLVGELADDWGCDDAIDDGDDADKTVWFELCG